MSQKPVELPNENINLQRYKTLTFAEKRTFRADWCAQAKIEVRKAKPPKPLQFETLAEGRKLVILRADAVRLDRVDGADVELAFSFKGIDVLLVRVFALMCRHWGQEIKNFCPEETIATLRDLEPEPSLAVAAEAEDLPVTLQSVAGSLHMTRGSLSDFAIFPSYVEGVEPSIIVITDIPIDTIDAWGSDFQYYGNQVSKKVVERNIQKLVIEKE